MHKDCKVLWDWGKRHFPQDIDKKHLQCKSHTAKAQNRLKWFLDFKWFLWNISTAKSELTHQNIPESSDIFHQATSAGCNRLSCRRGLLSSHLWEVLSPKPDGWRLLGPSSQRGQTFAWQVWWGETLSLMYLCTIWSKNMQVWPPVPSVDETTKKP